MAWQSEMVEIFRVMLNDLDTPPTYSDERLQKILVVAAHIVLVEIPFSRAFTADIENVDITPDPTDTNGGTRDDAFINLVCFKGGCLADRGRITISAGQAVTIRDGSSSIDLRGVAEAQLALLEKGWCAVYDDAKFQYLSGQVKNIGAAIMTPFRVFAGYNAIGAYYPVEDRGPNYSPF